MPPGTLFVVATPIGNLEDITLRALRVLREVSVVAAEDTRRTGNLLRHYEIQTPLLSLHEHNERQRLPQLIARLEAGESIALVTDAGTPGISDPGAQQVAGIRERGLRVEPIPGASSVITALSAAGQPADRFAFLGFPPIKAKDRKRYWDRLVELHDFLVVLFEAPHRIERTLSELRQFSVNRPITVARELTKAHEEFVSGPAHELFSRLSSPRGEFTILVGATTAPGNAADEAKTALSDEQIAEIFGDITKNNQGSRRDAIRGVADQTGLSSKAVYQALERIKLIGHSTE
jgi:16S rRNA (cytidine1402-2'-O)-methyltransferase